MRTTSAIKSDAAALMRTPGLPADLGPAYEEARSGKESGSGPRPAGTAGRAFRRSAAAERGVVFRLGVQPPERPSLGLSCAQQTGGHRLDVGDLLFVSSSSPAGVSPVRVAARRPGSRLAARSGNGPGRSPASKALSGGATERSVASSEACRVVSGPPSGGEGRAEPAVQGEGHGSGEEPGWQPRGTPRRMGRGTFEGGGGNWGGPPRPGGLRRGRRSVASYNR